MIAMAPRDDLWRAVDDFDSEGAALALKRLFEGTPLSGAVATGVLPLLEDVGDRWEAGTLSVAHEHFVSELVRRRLVEGLGPPEADLGSTWALVAA